MMQRLLAALTTSSLLVHPVLCSPTEVSIDQHVSRLESAVDRKATNRLARAISANFIQSPNNSSIVGYTYLGCYADTESPLLGSPRSLLGDRSYTPAFGMTWELCTAYCAGYPYAGITGGSTCRCGNMFAFAMIPVLDTLCSTPCTGNSIQSCGSSGRLTVFRSTNYVNPSSSKSAVVSINAAVALSPVVAAAALVVPSTLIPVVSLTSRPSTTSTVVSLDALPPQIPSASSTPLAKPSTLIGPGLAVAQSSISSGVAPATLLGPALSLVNSQAVTGSPSSPSTLVGLPLGVSSSTAQPPAPLISPSALSLSTPIRSLASQPPLPNIPLNPPNLILTTSVASGPQNLAVSASTIGLLAFPSVSEAAAQTSTLLPLAALATIPSPTAFQAQAQSILTEPMPAVTDISLTTATTTVATSAPSRSISPRPIGIQALAPIVPALLSPASLISYASLAAVTTPTPSFPFIPSSNLVVGSPVGAEASSPTVFSPVVPAIGSLGFLGGSPINPSAIVLPVTASSTIASPLALPTQLPFSAAPLLQLPSSVALPSIDLNPAGLGTVLLASASAGMPAAQLFGSMSDTTVTVPTELPLFATAFLPASLLPAVPTLLPAIANSATLLLSSILAQQPVALVPTITPAPTTLIPDNISLDQQFALQSDGATPWWVVTDFLEPHGLPTEPSYLPLPPLLIPGPTAIPTQESLPMPSPVDPGPPIVDVPDTSFSAAFTFDSDDFPWPFAAPYSPQPQPPILSPSFKQDAQVNLPSKKDITNRYAIGDSSDSGVIETGKLIAKVWTYEFYDSSLVRIDDTFLSPLTNVSGYLPDGTRIGLDSAGVYIGWEKRVPYGPEMLDVMKRFWLPEPQWFI